MEVVDTSGDEEHAGEINTALDVAAGTFTMGEKISGEDQAPPPTDFIFRGGEGGIYDETPFFEDEEL